MKIKPEHIAHIKAAIMPLHTVELYTYYKNVGLNDRRYRWDLTYKANLSQWLCDNVYTYADDTHIDTILRQITGTK